MSLATRLALAGASIFALAACNDPEPIPPLANGDIANITAPDSAATNSPNADVSNQAGSTPVTAPKDPKPKRPETKPTAAEPRLSPTQPPAEVDPVRNVDITDPG